MKAWRRTAIRSLRDNRPSSDCEMRRVESAHRNVRISLIARMVFIPVALTLSGGTTLRRGNVSVKAARDGAVSTD